MTRMTDLHKVHPVKRTGKVTRRLVGRFHDACGKRSPVKPTEPGMGFDLVELCSNAYVVRTGQANLGGWQLTRALPWAVPQKASYEVLCKWRQG